MNTTETGQTIIAPVSPIEQALVKANLTESVLNELKTYKALKIADINDKKGFEEVYKARQRCKNTRVLAKKICEKGREDAIDEQRRWVSKEKEIVGEIKDVEDYLQAEEDRINNEKQRLKEEAERKEQARINSRIATLLQLGMSFNGHVYSLGGNEIDYKNIKDLEDSRFNEFVSSVSVHADRIKEEQRLAKERNAQLLSYGFQYPSDDLGALPDEDYHKLLDVHMTAFEEKQREQERLKQQAIDQENERIRLAEEKRKFNEEQERIAKEQKLEELRLAQERVKSLKLREATRHKHLVALGMEASTVLEKFHLRGAGSISFSDVYALEDDQWDERLKLIEQEVATEKVKIEQERQQEIEQAKQEAIEKEQKRLKQEEDDRIERERIQKEQEQERINSLSDKNKMLVLVHKFQDFIDESEKDCPEFKTKKANSIKAQAFGMLNNAIDLLRKTYDI